jgi:hypothetical protein
MDLQQRVSACLLDYALDRRGQADDERIAGGVLRRLRWIRVIVSRSTTAVSG